MPSEMFCRCRPFSCGSWKQRFIWLERARCFCSHSLHIRVEVGGLSVISSPLLRRENNTYPLTINSCCYVFNKPPNCNFIKSETVCCLKTCAFIASNVIWSTAVWNYTLKSGWEKVKQIKCKKQYGNMDAGLECQMVSQPWAAFLDLLCWGVCSRVEMMSYHMHTQYTHTNTHYLTFQQQWWQLTNSTCDWKSSPPTSSVFTSFSQRYEVTLWTVTGLSVQTC